MTDVAGVGIEPVIMNCAEPIHTANPLARIQNFLRPASINAQNRALLSVFRKRDLQPEFLLEEQEVAADAARNRCGFAPMALRALLNHLPKRYEISFRRDLAIILLTTFADSSGIACQEIEIVIADDIFDLLAEIREEHDVAINESNPVVIVGDDLAAIVVGPP